MHAQGKRAQPLILTARAWNMKGLLDPHCMCRENGREPLILIARAGNINEPTWGASGGTGASPNPHSLRKGQVEEGECWAMLAVAHRVREEVGAGPRCVGTTGSWSFQFGVPWRHWRRVRRQGASTYRSGTPRGAPTGQLVGPTQAWTLGCGSSVTAMPPCVLTS